MTSLQKFQGQLLRGVPDCDAVFFQQGDPTGALDENTLDHFLPDTVEVFVVRKGLKGSWYVSFPCSGFALCDEGFRQWAVGVAKAFSPPTGPQ